MADKTLDQLTENTSPAAGDYIHVSKSANDYKRKISDTLDNSLTSTSTVKALTAAQGKALNDKIDGQKTPIVLTMLGELSANSALFKATNGFTYTWHGSDVIIDDIRAVQGTADTGGSQGYIAVINISGTNCLSGNLTLSASDDTYVQGSLSSTSSNLEITNGDTIEVNYDDGTNADAEDLAVFIYVKDNQ